MGLSRRVSRLPPGFSVKTNVLADSGSPFRSRPPVRVCVRRVGVCVCARVQVRERLRLHSARRCVSVVPEVVPRSTWLFSGVISLYIREAPIVRRRRIVVRTRGSSLRHFHRLHGRVPDEAHRCWHGGSRG